MTVESPPLIQRPIQRLDHIQALRGIAALMVVVSHLLIIEQKYSADQILGDWARYGMAGVDLFFVISGFIMVYVMWDRPRGVRAAGKFLWGRASRIYPLYWVVSLVLLALWFVRPDLVFSSIEAPPDILKSFALFPDDREPLLAVGWTLVHEMYFYLVFAGIMLLPRKVMLQALVAWFLVIVIFGGLYTTRSNADSAFLNLGLSGMTYEFILGAFFAWAYKYGQAARRANSSPKLEYWFSSLIILIGSVWLILEVSHLHNFPNSELRGGRLAIPCGMIVLGCAGRDGVGAKVWPPLITLGDWSYSLYLTHVLSLTLMGRVWAKANLDGPLDNIFILLAMIAVTIFISGLVYEYIEAPMIKAVRAKMKS